jgi:hypothetical protein
MAFYNYFWDLANSTTYADHQVGSFDNNTQYGGGNFNWIANVNNTTVSNIPGIRIKPTNTTNGYWLREMDGPIKVSWFGAQNTTIAPVSFATLGVSQMTLNNRYGVGFVSTADNYDTAAVKYAMYYMGTDAVENSLQFEPRKYWLTQSIELPVENTNIVGLPGLGGQGMFIIDGNGCTITTFGSGAPFDVFKRAPATQTDATNIYDKYAFTFKNFNATSAGSSWISSGYSFLFLGASPNSIIDNINLVNYDIGLRLEYCPNTVVSNVYTANVKTRSVYIKTGSWIGAGLTNASSDNCSVSHLHVNDSADQVAGLSIAGSNNCSVNHYYLNGVGNPQFGIWWDSLNNGVALLLTINNTYIAATTTNAGIYVKPSGSGMISINSVYNNQVHTLISAETYSGSPSLYVANIPNWPAGTKFSNTGTSKWDFNSVYLGAGIDTPAEIIDPLNNLWVTAGPPAIPSVSDVAVQPIGGQPQVSLQQVLDYDHDIASGLLFIGTDAGQGNTALVDVYALGTDAAKNNVSTKVIAIGNSAGENNAGSFSVFVGNGAGEGNTGQNVHAIGEGSCKNNTGSRVVATGQSTAFANTGDDVIALGELAAFSNTGDDVIALGKSAGVSNTINQSVIISNTCLPTYANHAAAILVITGPGATSGTYLYHNQATNSIGAVRIP